MSILFAILKVIGIGLLVLLCLLLVLGGCVLLLPIRYQVYVKLDETLKAKVKISYFFHIFSAFFGYDDGKQSGKVKILGFTIRDFFPTEEKKKQLEERENKKEEKRRRKEAAKQKHEEKKRKKKAEIKRKKNASKREKSKSASLNKQPEKKQEELKPQTVRKTSSNLSRTSTGVGDSGKEIKNGINNKTLKKEKSQVPKQPLETSEEQSGEKKPGLFGRIQEMKEKVVTFCKKIIDKVKNIKYTICNLWEQLKHLKETILFYYEILMREESKTAICKIKTQSGHLLKHMKPRKVKGIVEFGFEDPATTGDLFGKVCMFYPLYGNNIVVIPHFEEEVIKGELVLKGRIRIVVLFYIAWKIIFDKEVRILYKALTGGEKNE